MKFLRLSTLLIGSTLLLSASAFAANTNNTNKKTLHLYEAVTVAGTHLAPGDYKVEWNGSGPDVKVDILKGRDTVATFSAQVVSQSARNDQDGYTLKPGKDGAQRLAQVFFTGENYDLNIVPSSSANSMQGSGLGGTN
jgi:hypothetical protein